MDPEATYYPPGAITPPKKTEDYLNDVPEYKPTLFLTVIEYLNLLLSVVAIYVTTLFAFMLWGWWGALAFMAIVVILAVLEMIAKMQSVAVFLFNNAFGVAR